MRIASLLITLNALSVAAHLVDLSKDIEVAASMDTPGAKEVSAWAVQHPEVRVAMVLEHGKIVADYVRGDVDPNVPYHVWSATKSWTSLLIGLVVQEGKLSIDETLGEIFTDEQVWLNITDTKFRQNVTIKEMLTMSSGLYTEFGPAVFPFLTDGGSAGGGSLESSLQEPTVADKVFSYLSISNILSYVIIERTGMTPREYLAENVLPSLGIEDSDIDWWQNEDAVEYAYHGMLLTSIQMAKFGQLYLQMGKSSTENRLIGSDWVEASSSPQVEYQMDAPGEDGVSLVGQYGYLFWLWSGLQFFQNPEVPGFYCALGLGGQDICVSPELKRVSIQLRDFNETEDLSVGGLIVAGVAMNPNSSFEVAAVDTTSAGVRLCPMLSLGVLLMCFVA